MDRTGSSSHPLDMFLDRQKNISRNGGVFTPLQKASLMRSHLPIEKCRPVLKQEVPKPLNICRFSPKGSFLYVSWGGLDFSIFDSVTWKAQSTNNFGLHFEDISISPDEQRLVCCGSDSRFALMQLTNNLEHDSSSGRCQYQQLRPRFSDAPATDLTKVEFSADGTYFWAGGENGWLYSYDLEQQTTSETRSTHSGITAIAFGDEAGHVFYAGDRRGKLSVWDFRRHDNPNYFDGHTEQVVNIDSRGDRQCFISNSTDGTIKLWDIRNLVDFDGRYEKPIPNKRRHEDQQPRPTIEPLETYEGHEHQGRAVPAYFSPLFSTAKQFIYTGSQGASVCIYDLESAAPIAKTCSALTPRDPEDLLIIQSSWHPFSNTIVGATGDGDIFKWQSFGDQSSGLA